jgi:hypothetical protein
MTLGRAIAVIVACTLVIAGIGAGVGFALGSLVPGYYRSVFRGEREPGFDPIAVGLGQGLTQGTAGGVVTGLVVVALLCWREVRLQRAGEPPADRFADREGSTAWRVLMVTSFLLALGFSLCVGLGVGLLAGERGAYHRRYLEEREAIVSVLAGEPAFAGVEVHELSAGGAFLGGEVSSAEALDRLQACVTRAVGERRARDAVGGVSVGRSR